MWRFKITDVAENDLERLDNFVRRRVVAKLKRFVAEFDRVVPLPLGGEWHGFFKLRAGDWRIIYEINNAEETITVHLIDRRDKVYKRR